MHDLSGQVERTLALSGQTRELAERYAGSTDVLFIGRHTGYPAALERALKLKEISYIHAEGYPAGSSTTVRSRSWSRAPIVAVATSATSARRCSRTSKRCGRSADVIAVATEGDDDIGGVAQPVLFVPRVPGLFAPVVVTPPLQLLAYHVCETATL
jgi:glucosamine--fructose-6-phosphate aminotransferase (isomerizing)